MIDAPDIDLVSVASNHACDDKVREEESFAKIDLVNDHLTLKNQPSLPKLDESAVYTYD